MGPSQLLQYALQPFLEIPAVFGPRHHAPQVQGQDPAAAQLLRHFPGGDPKGQPLGNGGFPHSRFPDEQRIVFAPAAENADHPAQLRLPADHRVQASPDGRFRQVPGILLQDAGLPLAPDPRLGRRGGGIPAQVFQHSGKQPVRIRSGAAQQPESGAVLLPQEGQKQMLRGDLPLPQSDGLQGRLPDALPGFRGEALGGGCAGDSRPHGFRHQLPEPGIAAAAAPEAGGRGRILPGQTQ